MCEDKITYFKLKKIQIFVKSNIFKKETTRVTDPNFPTITGNGI